MIMSGITGINNKVQYGAIASGKRINSAADDAAGMSISKKLEQEQRGLQAAQQNAQMGMSAINVADGAMSGIADYLQSIREVSVRAMNGLYSDSDRQAMQEEINGYMGGIQQLARGTQFNTKSLLDGSMASMDIASNPNGTGMKIQLGDSTLKSLGLEGYSVMGNFDIGTIDNAIKMVSSRRSSLGSSANALEHASRYNASAAEQQVASRSRVEDLDIGKAISDQKKEETLQNYRIMAQKKQIEQQRNIFQLFT